MHYSEIGALSKRIRTQELSPVDICELTLTRIAEIDPELQSFVEVDAKGARAAAQTAAEEIAAGAWRGPLHGVPIAIKDLFSTGDAPTAFGSAHLADYRLDAQAEAVRRLREAGAVIVGRLRMSEAALTDHGVDQPIPLNPWDPETWVGTSSSGSAAATAGGLCFGALGSDTGGSVRGPATATGLSGLKPTRGVIPADGALPLSRTLDTVGTFARSAADCRIIFDVLSAADESGGIAASSARIGIDRDLLASVDPAIAAMVERTASTFAEMGAEIVRVQVPDGGSLASKWVDFVGYEAVQDISDLYPEDQRGLYGPEVAYVLERGRAVTAEQHDQIRAEADAFTAALDASLADVDAVLLPTIGTPSPTNAQIARMRRDYAVWNQQVMRITAPYNFSGHPAMTFPTGFTQRGTPLGAQLIGPHRSEHVLLSLVEQYQQVTDHHSKRPAKYA